MNPWTIIKTVGVLGGLGVALWLCSLVVGFIELEIRPRIEKWLGI